jgi:MtN3 and saliva related transmembrane protein
MSGVNYIEISRILTLIGSVGVIFGLYHQVFKIYKTKSAKDISVLMISALILSESVWLNYGVALSEWPIIAISCVNFPGLVLLAIGYAKYGRVKKTK